MTRVLTAGAGALSLAVSMARADVEVTVVEPDPVDAARTRDLLRGTPVTVLDRPVQAEIGVAFGPASALLCDHASALILIDGATAPARIRQASVDLLGQVGACPLIECHAGDPSVAQHFGALIDAQVIEVPHPVAAALVARTEDSAEALILLGGTPWELDDAMQDVGFNLGPCAAQDLRGLDRGFARHRAEDRTGRRPNPLPLIDRMVPEGRLGRKVGVGWYRYPGGGGRVIDPLVEDLAREEAHFARLAPRVLSGGEVAEVMIASLAAVADSCLASGIPPDDLDRIAAAALDLGPALALSRVVADRGRQRIQEDRRRFGKTLHPLLGQDT